MDVSLTCNMNVQINVQGRRLNHVLNLRRILSDVRPDVHPTLYEHTVLATAKFTSFSLMPQNENANFHARKRIILKTKAQIRKFITANETPNARKRKHANETSNARKRKHANESTQTRVCA